MDTIPNRGNNLFKILRRECEQMFFSSKTMQEIIVQCLIFNSTIKCYCLSHEYNYTSPNHFSFASFPYCFSRWMGLRKGNIHRHLKYHVRPPLQALQICAGKFGGKQQKFGENAPSAHKMGNEMETRLDIPVDKRPSID